LHALHLHDGPDQVLIRPLKTSKSLQFFISSGRQFHIFGPRCLKDFVPYFFDAVAFTINILRSGFLVFRLKMFFMYGGFNSFSVLKISVAKFLNFLISIVGLFDFSSSWL